MKIIASVLAVTAIIVTGCSSAPKPQEVKVEKPDFKVKEAASGGREGWMDNPQTWAEEMKDEKRFDTQNFYFYSGEGNSASKDLSCDKAQASMKDTIAKQVATFVDTAISKAASESSSSSTSNSGQSSDVNEEVERISTQLSKAMVSGVEMKKKYWERRDYSENGGPANIYYCWILGAAGKQDIKNLISKANSIKLNANPELKEKVENKLANIGDEYDKYMKTH